MNSTLVAVNFHGQDLFIVEHNGQPYTPMKTIVTNMGLDWSSQLAKLNANPKRWGMALITIPTLGDMQQAVCMPLRKLFGWLSTISPNRVKPELREKIIFYQNECDDVLWEHWTKNQPKRNGLVDLPVSPYLSHDDRTTLKEAVNAHCFANKKDNQQAMYWKLFHRFRADKVELLPAGKLDEMLIYLGLKMPTPHDMVSVRSGYLADLEQKAKALPTPATKFEPLHDDEVKITMKRFRELEQSTLKYQFDDLKHVVEQCGGLVLTKSEVDKIKGVLKA